MSRQADAVPRDCGEENVCGTPPGCARHLEARNRELVAENAILALAHAAMLSRIESMAGELQKPEDSRLRAVCDVMDGRAVIHDSIAVRVSAILSELDEWIERAGIAERERDRLRKIFDDAGRGEHNVLALIDYYQGLAFEADEQRAAAIAAIARIGRGVGMDAEATLHDTVEAVERLAQRAAIDATAKVSWELLYRERAGAHQMIANVRELLERNGCDCDCDHGSDDHDSECVRCLACEIESAIHGA